MEETKLDLVVAGTTDAVLMVESEANELTEEVMLGAVMFGHRSFQPVIDAIIKLAEPPPRAARLHQPEDNSELRSQDVGMVERRPQEGLHHCRQGRALRRHR
jgi:polyribonucleotide nucleotidyltransferase